MKKYKEQLQELYLKILESYNYGEDEWWIEYIMQLLTRILII